MRRRSAAVIEVHLPSWRNWQTRMVQVHVPATVWGFESLRWHQKRRSSQGSRVRLSRSHSGPWYPRNLESFAAAATAKRGGTQQALFADHSPPPPSDPTLSIQKRRKCGTMHGGEERQLENLAKRLVRTASVNDAGAEA